MGTQARFSQLRDAEVASQSELDAVIGGGNRVSNSGAESDTSGWSNSGSNFTISRTTTSGEVLKGTASFKLTANGSQSVNDYIYASFTLDPADRGGRVIAKKFYFKGISNYDSGDVEVVVHDGTNEIIPAITSIPGGDGFFVTTFISTSATNYTLRFKAKVTTAFSISIDNVYIGIQDVVQGAAIGNPTSYTLIIGATTTAPTEGTGVIKSAVWRRVGNEMELHFDYSQTGAGSAGSGTYLFPLPSTYTIDTSKLIPSTTGSNAVVGNGLAGSSGTPDQMTVFAWDSSNLAMIVYTGGATVSSGSYALSSATTSYSFTASVPISGWSSDIVLSNSRIEYAYNSDTSNTDNTGAFAYGINGGLVPTVSSTPKKKRGRWQTPVQPTDKVQLQIQPNGIGAWLDVGDSRFVAQIFDSLSEYYGMYLQEVNETDFDVLFNPDGVIIDGSSAVTWSTENSDGTRWRTIKCANPLAVESSKGAVNSLILRGSNGYGSSATYIPRFTSIDDQQDFYRSLYTYTDSSVTGHTIIPKEKCKVKISYSTASTATGVNIAISLNQSVLTAYPDADEILNKTSCVGTTPDSVSANFIAEKDDVIRLAHSNPNGHDGDVVTVLFEEI